ncbi:hypothetical protein CP10139811_0387 [Chlamydia ibidis]|uniref:Uncharacterized protein n=2 Tax=Chlamydia ibidis TaxID=1405396 RepID=S7J359_9CHLA|nr:hypothetical protein CP10139811_0387 [Chlamydia ibidis]EQM62303.1 hypothetical protein H359_0762 [Chlamydia ibidis 10-1398/6]
MCLIGLSSCSQPSLSSFTEFIDSDYCAAARLGISRDCTDEIFGQQVVMTWNLPWRMRNLLPATLRLHLYCGDGHIETLVYEVHRLSGYRIYCLKNEDYHAYKGIVSYKVTLFSGDSEIITRRHHLWTEVISFNNS